MIESIAIVGVGLIGGSFALALKDAGFKGDIVGFDLNEQTLKKAIELNVIDRYVTTAEAAGKVDMVVLAVPMLAMRASLEAIKPGLQNHTVITDVGSVKGSFVADAREVLDDLSNLVPGHPIAGTEHSGVEAAFSSLYRARRVILTPLDETRPQAVQDVKDLWELAGANVELLPLDKHDQVLAETSHLPHILAFSLVDALARLPDHEEIFRYAAGGFRDFTRIASSDPVMWRDVCLTNRDALLDVLGRYQNDLQVLANLIDQGDGETILETFRRAKQARDNHEIA